MATMVRHFWVYDRDGQVTPYEADYSSYPIREGVLCHLMVSHSERPCAAGHPEQASEPGATVRPPPCGEGAG